MQPAIAGASLPARRDGASLPSVLLVDDCPVARELACALLARWGIAPALASDGEQAVRLAAEHDYDLVIMDVVMPVLDGLSATALIRQRERTRRDRRRVPVLVYSSSPCAPAVLERLGVDAVLAKPADAASMGACLRRLCGDRFGAA